MNTLDPRHIVNGAIIPSEGYADQPYIVRADDGAWLCVMTTSGSHEGNAGQHVVSMRSVDQGKTWIDRADVEPADGPEASYAVLLKTPCGRIYCFYNHNTDNIREIKAETGEIFHRVDSLGHYVFKFSDDGGKSWSAQRYDIPIREFACDRNNVYGGKLRFFWNVGRPLIRANGQMILPIHKIGAMGEGFFAQSEGAFIASDNILTEQNPRNLRFTTLPDGDIGLRTPPGGGRVAEEQCICELSDGSLYCVYRSVDGWPVDTYSRDGGHTWSAPQYKTYTPGGRRIKHPRAANFAWRCANGMYLYWYHNHGGEAIRHTPGGWDPYNGRNPVWLAAGIERITPGGIMIEWSQPEILLYDDDPYIRMSYPDLVEDAGRYYFTETQKNIARVHEIPSDLLSGLFSQWRNRTVSRHGLVLELNGPDSVPPVVSMPDLHDFTRRDHSRLDAAGKDQRSGFSLDFWLTLDSLAPDQILLDNRTAGGHGFYVATTKQGSLRISLCDGQSESAWESDSQILREGAQHHIAIVVDGGPKIITFIMDGVLCDGGKDREFGWGRFNPALSSIRGDKTLRIASSLRGRIHMLRIYNRHLKTSEAASHFHAGMRC